MADKLTWDEIKRTYPDQWVVLVDYHTEGCDLTEGTVIDHGRVRDEVYDRLRDAPSPCAVRYTGELQGGLFGLYSEDVGVENQP
jgi:hypothetical protein